MNAADRLRRALLDQRAAILRGDVPETRSMAGVEGLLRKIGREEMPAIQALLRRNLDLLAIARDAVAAARAQPVQQTLRTYSAAGRLTPITDAPPVGIRR